jgi:TetR/AcrR family transcriptional regulator, transcriptional repressor for nem operon
LLILDGEHHIYDQVAIACGSASMKVSREQAAANRERIIEVAGKLFRENGFDGIGVADLMQAAGLTHGGFYGHFKSKDDLAAQACSRAMARALEKWAALARLPRGDARAEIIKQYLTESHCDGPGNGCLFAALGSDVGRQGRAIRRAFRKGLESQVDVLGKVAPSRSRAAKRKQALADMAQMVGAMVLARAVDDRTLAKEILDAAVSDLTKAGH